MSALIRRRLLVTVLGAGALSSGLLLTPTAAFADTGQTIVQTTDKAGDARVGLRNEPTADLLAAGARIASTVTAYFDLSTAPTQAQLSDAAASGLPYGGRYDYTSQIAVESGPGLNIEFFDTDAAISSAAFTGDDDSGPAARTAQCTARFGDGPAVLHTPVIVNATTGELSATFSRDDVNIVQSCYVGQTQPLTAGHQVSVTGAGSNNQTPYKNVLVGGAVVRDAAPAGTAVILNN